MTDRPETVSGVAILCQALTALMSDCPRNHASPDGDPGGGADIAFALTGASGGWLHR